MEVVFGSTFGVEIVEAEGQKKAILSGTLLNDSMNKNFWKVKAEDLDAVAKSVGKTQPVDIQHSLSDWEIVGSFIDGNKTGDKVLYHAEVTDTKAVNKFDTKTWTAQNMGISPTMEFGSLTCSICGKDPRKENCGHYRGETYDGKVAYIILNKPKLVRAGLTSKPAYAPDAGTISDVALSASLEKLLPKKEVESMVDNTLAEQLAQKDVKIKELQASVEAFTTKEKEIETAAIKKLKTDYDAVKAEVAKKDEKIQTLAAEKKGVEENLEAANKQITEAKAEKRHAELVELLGDKEVAQTIVDKGLSDEEFKAEVDLITKVKASVKTGANGSLPPDGGTNSGADIVKAEFGVDTSEMLENIGAKRKE